MSFDYNRNIGSAIEVDQWFSGNSDKFFWYEFQTFGSRSEYVLISVKTHQFGFTSNSKMHAPSYRVRNLTEASENFISHLSAMLWKRFQSSSVFPKPSAEYHFIFYPSKIFANNYWYIQGLV